MSYRIVMTNIKKFPCTMISSTSYIRRYTYVQSLQIEGLLKGSVKEPNMFHNYETEKISRKASDAAEYIELFGSSARDRHARRI